LSFYANGGELIGAVGFPELLFIIQDFLRIRNHGIYRGHVKMNYDFPFSFSANDRVALGDITDAVMGSVSTKSIVQSNPILAGSMIYLTLKA